MSSCACCSTPCTDYGALLLCFAALCCAALCCAALCCAVLCCAVLTCGQECLEQALAPVLCEPVGPLHSELVTDFLIDFLTYLDSTFKLTV